MAQTDTDIGARVRAARSYANLSQAALAEQLGLERRIVVAIEANAERHELTVKEAQRIARICDVPIAFLTQGWAAPAELVDRVAALEEGLSRAELARDALVRSLGEMRSLLRARLGIYAETGLEQDRTRASEDAPRREQGPPTP